MKEKTAPPPRIIKTWHHISGIILAVFIGFHLLNQLMSLGGPEAHIHFMDRLRVVYRYPPVEVLLLAAVFSQLVSGIRLLFSREKRSTAEKIQRYTGMYLSYFLLVHVSAVFLCRLHHLDSNFWLAAVGLNYHPATFYFLPYYFLAVTSITLHVAALHYRKTNSRWSTAAIAAAGTVTAVLILIGFTAMFGWRDAPPAYQQLILPYFGRH